jgi:hypothetical protein
MSEAPKPVESQPSSPASAPTAQMNPLDGFFNVNNRLVNLERLIPEFQKILEQQKNMLVNTNNKTQQDLILLQIALMLVMLRTIGVKDQDLRTDLTTYLGLARLIMKDLFDPERALEATKEAESKFSVNVGQ